LFDEGEQNFTQFMRDALIEDKFKLIREFCLEEENRHFVFESITTELPDPIQYKCPMTSACIYYGAAKSFDVLVDAGCSTNTVDSWGKSCAHFAAEFGKLDFMRNPKFGKTEYVVIDWRGRLPVHYAAQNNHLDVMRFLVEEKGCDFTLPDNFGMTALHAACQNGSFDVAKYLIEKGAKLDLDFIGRSPIDFAVQADAKEIIEYVAQMSSEAINTVDANGTTYLHKAVFAGAVNVVQLLKNQINAQDSLGFTPLHYVGQYSSVEIVGKLIEAGANINATANNGLTPLMVAAQCNNRPVVEELLKVKELEINKKDAKGWTALHHASNNSSFNVITLMIQRGCDPNAKDNEGKSPKEVASGLFGPKCRDLVAGIKIVIGDIKNPGKGPVYTKYEQYPAQEQANSGGSGCEIF
jgi:ankyrin repeat protein